MVSYTVERHVQMIKIYNENECLLVKTMCITPNYGRRGGS